MASLPTLYEHYTGGGINAGLSINQANFTLNNKYFSLYGGSMHYFRVPSEYWRDRLRKLRAAGLNTVTTYVPWNLHEPEPGKYDFGSGGTDMQDFLNIEKFLKTAKEEDLFVVMRPGPFICAEFEFGGFPSWLLREDNIIFRTYNHQYMKHVRRYFNVLLTLLAAFQFTKGGPIIAFQVENEYGSTENATFQPDSVYIESLRQLMLNNNISELLFTSDSPYDHGSKGSLPTLFQTANFNKYPERQFDTLKVLQPNKPSMATEFWSGWFMHWSEQPYIGNVEGFTDLYERILKYPASVNLYMFHGGTSWGFLNGANRNGMNQSQLKPDITSYDYDAPLNEFGNYTLKYFVVKKLLEQYNRIKTKLPELPKERNVIALPEAKIQKYISYEGIISQIPYQYQSEYVKPMELLPINNNTGQSFGYIIYRKKLANVPKGSVLLLRGYVRDTVNVYLNNKLVTDNVVNLDEFGYWRKGNSSIIISHEENISNATLDIVVCNMGRNNFGKLDSFYQFKGLVDKVYLNQEELKDWTIVPVEFRKKWLAGLSNWNTFKKENDYSGLGFYKTEIDLNKVTDTFLDMSKWKKGIVVVNDFVLGRYWTIGPQQSLYLPAPFLKVGSNEIIVLEEFYPQDTVHFVKSPLYFNNK